MEDTYIVFVMYKGHLNQYEIESKELKNDESWQEHLRRKKISGGIEEIWEPGSWEYDSETCCPRRI